MKKITLFAFAVVALSLASCKKDRTCTCTTSTPGGNVTQKTTYYKVKKKDVREACVGNQTETTTSAGTTTGNKTTCELK